MRTRIVTERRGERTAAVALAGGALRPRVLGPREAGLRVALVQARAGLLAGDRLALEVTVGAGTTLELVEPAATVVHDSRGGSVARWSAEVVIEPGATLVWLAAPFIVAAGAHVRRSLRADIAEGGTLLVRETLVLGRAHQSPGRALIETSVRYDDRALLEEALHTDGVASPVVAGPGAKVIDTLALLGVRPPPEPDTWALHGPGAVRALPAASCAEAEAANRGLTAAWRELALASSRPPVVERHERGCPPPRSSSPEYAGGERVM